MGRNRKPGKRKHGRLVFDADARLVKGNERAQARRDLYGGDGWDNIGRAYTLGLLGEGEQAKLRLDTGRKLASLYRRTYARGYRCALNQEPRGGVSLIEGPFAMQDEEWLISALGRVATACPRRAFDAFVLDDTPDEGPIWADRLMTLAMRNRVLAMCKRKPELPDPADSGLLNAVLAGLDAIEPPRGMRGAVRTTRAA